MRFTLALVVAILLLLAVSSACGGEKKAAPTMTPPPAAVTAIPSPTPTPAATPAPPSGIETAQGFEASVFYAADLRAPENIVVGADDSLYVADSLARQVVRIQPNGELTTVASGVQAVDLAFGPKGQLFVMTHGDVLRLSESGDLVPYLSANSLPVVEGTRATFFGIAIDSDGDIFAVDKLTGTLHRFDTAGSASIVTTDLNLPVDLAFSPSGELYVAERGKNRIVRVDEEGATIPFSSAEFAYPVDPQELPAFADPLYIAFGPSGDLYVHGFLGVFSISPHGAASPAVVNGRAIVDVLPSAVAGSLAFDSLGNLYLADPPGAKITKVAPDGEVEIVVPGFNPKDIGVTSNGEVLAVNSEGWPISHSELLRLTSRGHREVLATFNGIPVGLALNGRGDIYVSLVSVPGIGGQIVRVLPDGSLVEIMSGENAWRIAFSPSGQLFFVAFDRGEIWVVEDDGQVAPYATGFSGVNTSIGFDAAGNMYATDTVAGAVVRVTPDGGRRVVALIPDLRERPQDIVVAPSGDVYVVAHWRYMLWHVSPDGTVEELASRILVDPFGIDLGPDGSIYVSRSGSVDRIYPR